MLDGSAVPKDRNGEAPVIANMITIVLKYSEVRRMPIVLIPVFVMNHMAGT